jgi:hypothetical protein
MLQTSDVGFELRKPDVGRNVQCIEGLLANDAIDSDAVPRLEAAHRSVDVGIEHVLIAAGRAEIAGNGKTAAQRRHARMFVAEPQPIRRRHRRPSALRDDVLISADGGFSCLHRAGRERRQ